MPINDSATRRRIEDALEHAFSPLEVQYRWEQGDLWVEVEGHQEVRIASESLSWSGITELMRTWRGDLQRKGVTLAAWEPPL